MLFPAMFGIVIAALVAPVVGAGVGTEVGADVDAGGIVAFPCPPITMGAGASVLLDAAAGCAVLVATSVPPQAESTLLPAIAAMPMSNARRLNVFVVCIAVVEGCWIVTYPTPSRNARHSLRSRPCDQPILRTHIPRWLCGHHERRLGVVHEEIDCAIPQCYTTHGSYTVNTQ